MYLLHLWQRGQQGSDPLSRTGLSPAGAIQLLKKWHHVESIYTGVLGTVENLLPAHSSVVKVALVNQQCCHHGVFLSSVTHALSLPLSTFFFFKVLAATNSMLFCSCTFWFFLINKTTKPRKLGIKLKDTAQNY